MAKRGPKILFRGKDGRFLPQADRYKPTVTSIEARRGGQYVQLASRPLPPEDLADLLSQREFESLPEALQEVGTFKSGKKYKAWDIAEQVDKTKRLRRKNLKMTLLIDDGGRQKKITFYHNIKRNTASSYAIFRRINQEVGLEGFFLYDKAGGKHISDRKGKQVKLVSMKVETVV